MGELVAVTRGELALILEALDDAAYYRDTRSRVLQSAVRRRVRRSASSPVAPADPGGTSDAEGHRRKAQAYGELAVKLKRDL